MVPQLVSFKERPVDTLARNFYKALMVLAGVSMVAAFGAIALNIVARVVGWDIPGLDGYAGYSIAATLFLALPGAFRQGDHIRTTLLLQRVGPRAKVVLEYWCLLAGLAISSYLAWFACRLVWQSHSLHDIAATADATPLWIPQLSMAIGCVGFAVSFLHALLARVNGRAFFVTAGDEAAHAE
jgi:TRAP-type C4-dicarboxylate transport system permease small subunit